MEINPVNKYLKLFGAWVELVNYIDKLSMTDPEGSRGELVHNSRIKVFLVRVREASCEGQGSKLF